METIQWDGKTFQLPIQPKSATPSLVERDCFVRGTLRAIDNAQSASESTKLAVIETRFGFTNLLSSVNSGLSTLLNTSVGQNDPAIVLTDGAVLSFSLPSLRVDSGNAAAFPGAGVIAPLTRRNSVFLPV
jgi:hypothetical protein